MQPRNGNYPGQGAEKLIVLGGIGCLAFVAMLVAVVVVGISMLVDIARKPQEAVPEIVDTTPPGELPAVPFPLPVPAAPSTHLGPIDLEEVDAGRLASEAIRQAKLGDVSTALSCQYVAVIKSGSGRYNLACFYSLAGNVDAALYWLQMAAREEGTDPDWATKDSDLTKVWRDARWPRVLAYLRKCQQYWETSGFSETALILPRQAATDQPIPVFIGLHPAGHFAHGFLDAAASQALADEMGVAFLAVSGTIPYGKETFAWSEDPAKDLARIDAALEEVKDRLTPAEGQMVLYGFSQGAWVAGELAARHPDRFAGAIVMSPDRRSSAKLPALEARDEHRRQGLVAVCGEEETPETVRMTKAFAERFAKLRARVSQTLYPGKETHSLPPDYVRKLPVWGRFILDPAAAAPE
jgi:predicted esterase